MKKMELHKDTRRFFKTATCLTLFVATSFASAASAGEPIEAGEPFDAFSTAPDCIGQTTPIPVDNAAVLKLKTSTPNQFLTRAHIAGTIEQVYPDKNGHTHFELQIGNLRTDTIEVVYNDEFGQLPQLKAGMTAEACGDYITSDAPTSQYPASPDNAIIHWIHRNPKGHGHASGFLTINGALYGQGSGH